MKTNNETLGLAKALSITPLLAVMLFVLGAPVTAHADAPNVPNSNIYGSTVFDEDDGYYVDDWYNDDGWYVDDWYNDDGYYVDDWYNDDGYYVDDWYNDDCYYGCGGYGGGYDSGFNIDIVYEHEEYDYDYEYDHDYDDHYDREPRPTCDISATDNYIEEDESTTLRWNSAYASEAKLTDHGSVSEDGSKSVSPNQTTTYTLTVTGVGGKSTCYTTVHVDRDDDDDDDDDDDNDEPWCDLEASDTRVEEGDEITLEWDTRNAEYASINQGIGRVDEDGGEEDVDIDDDDDVTFRMTVRNDDGDEETCSVTVRVDEDDDDNNFSSVDFDSGPVKNPPVVYLSDLPYTGIEDITPSMIGMFATLAALLSIGGYYVFLRREKVRA